MQCSTSRPTSTPWCASLVPLLPREALVRLFRLMDAAIYCYACDEDRNDDKLTEHLGVLGIDVKSQTKTEKTV